MIPNFPIEDELDSLEYMKFALNSGIDENNKQNSDYHFIIMLSLPEPFDPKKKIDFSKENFKGHIIGGVVFEYFYQVNVGLLTYLVVNSEWRGHNIGTILVEKCKISLEEHAISRGHLAGCNAVFLETNSAVKVKESFDVMPPKKRHEIFYNMGLRLVDFDYVQAPLDKNKNKVNYLLLCCFITPRIPSINSGSRMEYYLPNSLLINTMYAFWSSAPSINRKFYEDVDFKRMIDQLKRSERIPLLALPWERPWTLLDIRKDFDAQLLYQFYHNFYETIFPYKTQRVPLTTWFQLLSDENRDDPSVEDFHVLLAIQIPTVPKAPTTILGGFTFTYYISINCGLLSFISFPVGVENDESLGRNLLQEVTANLNKNAIYRGNIAGCNALFMEAPHGSTRYRLNNPLLYKEGWRMLDFVYYRPPLSISSPGSTPCPLLILLTPNIPSTKNSNNEVEYYIPKELLRSFLFRHWEESYKRIGLIKHKKDPNYSGMMKSIKSMDKIRITDIPWDLSYSKL